ncbi:MAG TPA: GGDEF domain-containing protein, partial [Gammaproteobacteria bacterium]|nr:GGDEF domain-containing protein [Gammaproteobacteria bacterium]
LLAALWGMRLLENLSAEQIAVVKWLPALLLAAAMAMAARFGRSRTFFVLLNLLLAWLGLAFYLPASATATREILYAGIALLLPLNLLVTAYLRERGPLFSWRNSRYLVLVVEIIVLVVIAEARVLPIARLLTFTAWPDIAQFSVIPQPGLLVLVVGLFLTYGRLHASPGNQRAALFATLLAVFGLLDASATQTACIAWFSAAALIHTLALAQESWNLAYMDTLTELPGRRALEEMLAKLAGQYAIAMVDVDHFKRFNDTYGHHVGDEVLRMVAYQLRDTGGGARAFRYGGEEFCVVFDGKRAKETVSHLESVREQVAAARFELRQRGRRRDERKPAARKRRSNNISVTISLGLAESGNRHNRPGAVLAAADKALYKAKKQGRNRLCR